MSKKLGRRSGFKRGRSSTLLGLVSVPLGERGGRGGERRVRPEEERLYEGGGGSV